MTEKETTDETEIEPEFDHAARWSTKELTDDADTETTRRRFCQALSVLGGASLAGCEGLPGDGSGTRNSESQRSSTGTSTPVPSAADMGDLIDGHVSAIGGQSYTVAIELQGSGSDPDIKKNIEYLRSMSGEALVSLTEESTINDGVESLTHYFTPDLHGVDIGFIDGTSNAAALDISSQVIEITGASVFDRFLVGAAVEEPESTKADETGEALDRYQIRAHRRYDLDRGFVTVDENDVIRRFRLEWTDSEGIGRWVDAEIYDIGTTKVDIPNF